MPIDTPSTLAVDASQAPSASQGPTIIHVPAEYFVGIETEPDHEPSYAHRYPAEIIMVIGEDGKTLLHGEVHVDDPGRTSFNLEGERYTVNMKKDVVVCTGASIKGMSLLAWPPTGKIPGGRAVRKL
jgi:hypothetical protein